MAISKIQLVDIPTSAGCLELGTELFPSHMRGLGLKARLNQIGVEVADLGAIVLPEFTRHNKPPIRNYPGPRETWRATESFFAECDFRSGLTLALGGDCSIVVGTMAGLQHIFDPIHLIYIDGDMDSMQPDPTKCVGSAGMGLWMLTQESDYWNGSRLLPSQITVLGNKEPPATDLGIKFVSLERLKQLGIQEAMAQVLASLPQGANIAVHFDVDVLSSDEMPAAYAPRAVGLSLTQAQELLAQVLADSRVRYLEVTEFVPSKDPNGDYGRALIDLLASGLQGELPVPRAKIPLIGDG